MTTTVATREQESAAIVESVVIGGDLGRLTAEQRVAYYRQVCDSVGLNPWTRPFDYLVLNGKLTLYANRGASDQLRRLRAISIEKVEREELDGIFLVTVYGRDKDNRVDTAIGAVPIDGLKGEARANAMMKAETKAKRRLTLALAGLGWLDESEVDSIGPAAMRADVDPETGEILSTQQAPRQLPESQPDRQPPRTTRLPSIPKGIATRTSLGEVEIDGTINLSTGQVDGNLRQSREGPIVGFRLALDERKRIPRVFAPGELANAIADAVDNDPSRLEGLGVRATGELFAVPWKKDNEAKPPFLELILTALAAPDWKVPPDIAGEEVEGEATDADEDPAPDGVDDEPAAKPKRASRAKPKPETADEASDAAQPEPHGDAARDVVDQTQQAAPTGPGLTADQFAALIKDARVAKAYVESVAQSTVGVGSLDALTDQQRHQVAAAAELYAPED